MVHVLVLEGSAQNAKSAIWKILQTEIDGRLMPQQTFSLAIVAITSSGGVPNNSVIIEN